MKITVGKNDWVLIIKNGRDPEVFVPKKRTYTVAEIAAVNKYLDIFSKVFRGILKGRASRGKRHKTKP